jgi:hypothetical protein
MTMRLVIHDREVDHFVIFTNEPMRVEISLLPDATRDSDGPVWDRIIAHAYRGETTDMEQEPTLTYDGSQADEMEDMTR